MNIKVADEDVFLDPENLVVDENNLNSFLKSFAGNYNHYNGLLAKAQHAHQILEDVLDTISSEKFKTHKETTGGSDKLVESKVQCDEDVVKIRRAVRDAKYAYQSINLYLRSLDKAHEGALNLGYNLRKEMDKVFPQNIKCNVDNEVAKYFSTNEG